MLLVTGITGHSGRCFLQELIKNKYDDNIRCIVRSSSLSAILDNSGLKIEKFVGDLEDKSFLDKVMIGIDTVVHIYNIHHSVNIINAAIKNNVGRAILVHTTGIYSKYKSASKEYKVIEKKIQDIMKLNIINITILRPTMIYGDMCDHNISKLIYMIDKMKLVPVINHGTSLIQPINARDLGRAYYAVLISPIETAGKEYNLSGEHPISMLEVLKLISKTMNRRTIFVSVPMNLAIFVAVVLKAVTIKKIDYIEIIHRMGEDKSYSHEAAFIDFGYVPLSFEDGIQIEINEYMRQKIR